jgi:hypothetical protein
MDFHDIEYPKKTLTPFESCNEIENSLRIDTIEITNGFHVIKKIKVTCP